MLKSPTFKAELAQAKPREIIPTDHGSQLITLEQFSNEKQKELVIKAGRLLGKTYKGYGWMVRHIGNPSDPMDFGIGICLSELIQFFGTRATMYLNPNDFENEIQFEQQVKKIGGELLERARLSRTKNLEDPVTKMPDGFEQFQKKVIYKTLDTVDAVVDAVKKFEKEQKENESVTDSTQIETD